MMKRKSCYLKIVSLFVITFLSGHVMFGQAGMPTLPGVTSPKINCDRTVTFSLKAPCISEAQVMIKGDTVHYPMRLDLRGRWNITVGPLEPGTHSYVILVDGQMMQDNLNPEIQSGVATGYSLLNIPENPPCIDELKDVPHGTVQVITYYSTVQKKLHRLYVYLPPSYDQDADMKYPVLYLRHGGGENESSWFIHGSADIIMDNLLAEGKVQPMIIVMTNGNLEAGMPVGYNNAAFQIGADELITDVFPVVEKKFRVYADQQHRAVAGLSMGAGQSFYIGLRNPDKFDWVGVFGTGLFGGIKEANFNPENTIPGILTNTPSFNDNLQLLYISVGEQDPRVDATNKFVNLLREHNMDVVYQTFPGVHEWKVWCLSLHDFLQRIFIQ